MIYKVLVSDPLSDDGIKELLDAEHIQVDKKTGMTEQELLDCIGEYDALLVRSQTQVTRKVIEKATKLKAIGRAGVGTDNIDLAAATEHGVVVVNAPNGNTISTAEHTMAMLAAMARRVPQAYYSLRQDEWNRKAFIGVELYRKTLGIIGFGRIGGEVAKRAQGFGMRIIASDPFLTEEKAAKLGIQYGSMEDVLEQADFITVHTPLLKETHHLISHEQFGQMKDGVYVLNCARGGLVDENALLEAIQGGKVAGASLDVFENEPQINHELLALPEVIATPHLGASTVEAQEMVAVDVSREIADMLSGKPAKNPVNMPAVSKEVLQKLEPYFSLCEKLGSFLAQISRGAIAEITVTYSGELQDTNVDPLTRLILKHILKHYLGQQINEVNAFHVAKQKEIVVNEQKTTSGYGFTNLIAITVRTNQETRTVSGTRIEGGRIELVNVDQYRVDVIPTGHMIYIHHTDQPGVIGKVGTFLGQNDVNIATMQVGRKERGGDAIMLLSVDKNMEQALADELAAVPEIIDVTTIEL
ncbi:phosphoglycerate dehydrogenase [Planococcus lenghuensis]|uniref:D-3-phosphoglycerate dehydrogenase n=1 Tax=Planococcus lenghuensis TaxID=2213202 RepID=A0A1Q2L112_9BACL|nr:phosphoglycerate dehydrogenase [Planococcus lenghuensis]AQQ53582.1 phosphoglycerate dehydrogenase [Planococcus lenghuensis]